MTHDKLQSECFKWFWNTHPELRGTFWCTFNDVKCAERMIGTMMKIRLPTRVRSSILALMKTLGMVKGVLDFNWYYKGVLYVWDFKVGNDRLSPDQKRVITAIEAQGGQGGTIETLEEFKCKVEKVLNSEK